MLVLSRKKEEAIVIKMPEGDVRIILLEADKGRCRLGIEAPKGCAILREELLKEIENANRASAIVDEARVIQTIGGKV
jgi:carbon storage regulator CsrA